jgi:hypothetical protein
LGSEKEARGVAFEPVAQAFEIDDQTARFFDEALGLGQADPQKGRDLHAVLLNDAVNGADQV